MSYVLKYGDYEFCAGRIWDPKNKCIVVDLPSDFLDGKTEGEIVRILDPIIIAYQHGRKEEKKNFSKKIKKIFDLEEEYED